ncbi:MAG: hypothetical protein C0602_11940 [Denitrovibrio sp.]|nr:MAG: hypothetical protein C0602_11940 [Denitrovibrio sp.]
MRKILFVMSVLILTTVLSSYAFESFEEYLKMQQAEYENYLEEIDREFTAFLKQTWKEYEGEEPIELLEEPKPVDIPVAVPEKKPEPIKITPKPKPKPVILKEKPVSKPEPKPEPVKDEPVVDSPKPAPAPVKEEPVKKEPVKKEPVVKAPEPEEPVVQEPVVVAPTPEPQYVPKQEAKGLALSFYGRELDIPVDNALKAYAKRPLSSKHIADWWEAVAVTDYKKTLKYFKKTSVDMKLGDWCYVNLVERFAAKLMGDVAERKLLVWFFMNKGGYDTKLGYTKEGVVKVMVPTDKELYGVTYYTFSGKRYYVIDVFGKVDKVESLYTYKGSYPDARNELVLSKMQNPKLGFNGFARDLKFNFDGKDYKIQAIANKFDIAYLNNFPQADLAVYTGAQAPEWIDQTILPELKKIIEGKNPREAVNIILRFVQTAFEYKTDDVQFGKEKFLFAEETVYYPYSDCEDRSVLFAYLVGKLLKLDMIMLDFPGHIAVAVDLGKYNTGAVVGYKGKSFSVTDPTYINATAGMVMPQYKDTSPEIIEPEI